MKTLLLSLLVLALLLGGCAPRYMIDRPYVISPCYVEDPARSQDHATASLLLALRERKWIVNKIDREEHRIVAEGCRRGQNCVSISARILADGTIEALRNPQPSFEQVDLLKKWMAGLDRNYKSHCLTSYEAVLAQLRRRGIDYENLKAAVPAPVPVDPESGDTED
jgi:hypothetical protein